jgi:hypothetical protein
LLYGDGRSAGISKMEDECEDIRLCGCIYNWTFVNFPFTKVQMSPSMMKYHNQSQIIIDLAQTDISGRLVEKLKIYF